MGFGQRLTDAVLAKQSVLCVGIDPTPNQIPKEYEGEPVAFARDVIRAVSPYAVAAKPNIAFWGDVFSGPDGGMRRVCETARYEYELVVVVDMKRSDIGKTTDWYAVHLREPAVDAVTSNAQYFGRESMRALLTPAQRLEKGVFFMVRTSNTDATETQDVLLADGRRYWNIAAQMVQEEGVQDESGYGHAGAVFGATVPEQMEEARRLMPTSLFLVPGYGAQGGGSDGATRGFVKEDGGRGGIVNSSSGITGAWCDSKSRYKAPVDRRQMSALEAIGFAARDARNDLVGALRRRQLVDWPDIA